MRPLTSSDVFIDRCKSGVAWCSSKIGPGVVTGAADDDPSGIATYAIAGASLGFGLLWVALITTPMMIVVQEACARIAMVTGRGLASGMRRVMPLWLLRALVFLVVGANTLNIAADIAGMSSAGELVSHVPSGVWAVALGTLLVVVEVFASYRLFASVVKWLCLSLLAYVVDRVRRARRLACRAAPHGRAGDAARPQLDGDVRRFPRHDDHAVPVLLAGRARGGGRARRKDASR